MLRIEYCDWFILLLLLPTPTMQFSLDRKRRSHKRVRCSASDSDSLIFTRSYLSALLIMTPTTTPTPSLYNFLPSESGPPVRARDVTLFCDNCNSRSQLIEKTSMKTSRCFFSKIHFMDSQINKVHSPTIFCDVLSDLMGFWELPARCCETTKT